MTDRNPFDAARLKLRRARRHIDELTEQLRAYISRSPFYLELADAPSYLNGKKWVLHVVESVPSDFSAIIGDAIHNLRSALDLMACELVRANNQSDSGVYFPFAESATELEGMIARRHMDRASAQVVDLIRSTAPFKGGNAALRAIHDLDIIDKHQSLIPVFDMVGTPEVPGMPPSSVVFTMGPIEGGMEVFASREHATLPAGYRASGTFVFRFGSGALTEAGLEGGPLGGGEVIPTLVSLADLVDSLNEAFSLIV
jgi:hypothetical protein